MKPFDPLAWTKLDAQRRFVAWFRGDTILTIAEAMKALNIAAGTECVGEFPGEPELERAHLSCLDWRDGDSGGVCLSLCEDDPEFARASMSRWAIGIALAWAMGAPFEGRWFSHADRDEGDALWEAFDALGAMLLVPEDVVRDVSRREAHSALRVHASIVEEALDSRELGMRRHEAALVAFANELATERAAASPEAA